MIGTKDFFCIRQMIISFSTEAHCVLFKGRQIFEYLGFSLLNSSVFTSSPGLSVMKYK